MRPLELERRPLPPPLGEYAIRSPRRGAVGPRGDIRCGQYTLHPFLGRPNADFWAAEAPLPPPPLPATFYFECRDTSREPPTVLRARPVHFLPNLSRRRTPGVCDPGPAAARILLRENGVEVSSDARTTRQLVPVDRTNRGREALPARFAGRRRRTTQTCSRFVPCELQRRRTPDLRRFPEPPVYGRTEGERREKRNRSFERICVHLGFGS